jgi:hypothetical protein
MGERSLGGGLGRVGGLEHTDDRHLVTVQRRAVPRDLIGINVLRPSHHLGDAMAADKQLGRASAAADADEELLQV